MKLSYLTSALILGGITSLSASAAQLEISVSNITHGNYFTPVLIAAHDGNTHLFQTGEMATPSLQKMAEGGAIADLAADVKAASGLTVDNPAAGLMAPGAKASGIMLDTQAMTHLSLVAMVLPTNDGFVGLDSWEIPTIPGTYTINVNAYDAGTEANDEIINGGGAPGTSGIPAAPGMDGGANGTGVSDTASNTKVHIHPGVLGDTDVAGGASDLDSRIHRWLNPVARVVVVVK